MFQLSVVGEALVLSFAKRPPPTAVILAYFNAVWAGEGTVDLAWGTGVEYDVLGFFVDRRAEDESWARVTGQLLPATGANQQPQSYRATDANAPAAAGLKYRLVGVNLSGQEHVLAEATVRASAAIRAVRTSTGVRLEVRGEPNATVAVEAAPSVTGPWTDVQTLALDGRGASTLWVGADGQASVRFYRVMCE
jgi:hypothetical protein